MKTALGKVRGLSVHILAHVAAISSVVVGVGLVLVGIAALARDMWRAISHRQLDSESLHSISISAIEVADTVLLGIVIFTFGLGLHRLYVDKDSKETDLKLEKQSPQHQP